MRVHSFGLHIDVSIEAEPYSTLQNIMLNTIQFAFFQPSCFSFTTMLIKMQNFLVSLIFPAQIGVRQVMWRLPVTVASYKDK